MKISLFFNIIIKLTKGNQLSRKMSKKLKRLNTDKPKPNSNKKREARKRARTNRFLRKKLKKEGLKESVEKKKPQKSQESNPGQLGEKQVCFLCIM